MKKLATFICLAFICLSLVIFSDFGQKVVGASNSTSVPVVNKPPEKVLYAELTP